MTIALPIALFALLAGSTRDDVLEHAWMALVALIVMGVVYAASFVLQRRAFDATPGEAAVQALTVAFPNAAAVALPLADSVLGATGGLAVAAVLAVGCVTLSPLTVVILEREKARSAAAEADRPRNPTAHAIGLALRKPVVIAPALGVAWSLLGIPLPSLVEATLDELGSVTGGLALFLTGLVLSAQPIRVDVDAIVSTVLTVLVRPLLALLAIQALGWSGAMAQETLLLLAVPAGFFGILLGIGYGAKPPVAGSTLLFSSVLSIATITVVILLIPQL